MSLTDGDVASLARQAVDLVDPDARIRIDPAATYDPYLRSTPAWQVVVPLRGHVAEIRLAAAMDDVAAVTALLAGLTDAAESAQYGGRPFPPCPGHDHASRLERTVGGGLVLRCPNRGEIIARFGPDAD